MTKIAVNRCFGGFQLSFRARDILYERGSLIGATPVQTYGPSEEKIKDDKVTSDSLRSGAKADDMFVRYVSVDGLYYLRGRIGYDDRTDPQLIRVIEELGDDASCKYSNIVVVEIPDDVEWQINDYDGSETVEEKHRSW